MSWIRAKRARVAFDSNALIYLVEQVPPYHTWLLPFFNEVAAQRATAVISVIALAEALVGTVKRGDVQAERAYLRMFSSSGIEIVEVNEDLAKEAAIFRARTGLSLPDSIVIESSRISGCDVLIGNDRQWRKQVAGITYVYLDDVVAGGRGARR